MKKIKCVRSKGKVLDTLKRFFIFIGRKRILFGTVFFLIFLMGIVFFWADFSYRRPLGGDTGIVRVEIVEGDDGWVIAEKLKKKNLISSEYVFLFGVWRDGLRGTFHAGVYELTPSFSPADIAMIISRGEARLRDVKITFPEGWTAKEMGDRLTKNGLSGEEFFKVTQRPTEMLRMQFRFLEKLPEGASLEGYLFPETYFFLPEMTGEEIAQRMLETFESKTRVLREECLAQKKDFADIVTMASIVEGEVRTQDDRRIVSGIFWKRIESEMLLQSDATLEYVLQSGKVQHSEYDLATDSPYNTYLYKGLPPGPISNPSLDALDAATHPKDSPYWYFLSDPKTGVTYFAKDFEEHKRNKEKAGL